jgi:hypothetical protein
MNYVYFYQSCKFTNAATEEGTYIVRKEYVWILL